MAARLGDLDHLDCRGNEDAGESSQRDVTDVRCGDDHHRQQGDGMGHRRQPGSRARPDVDRGSRDRRGRRDAAEERNNEVGHTLPEQLPVGVVAFADPHPVGDGRRKQALECRERRDGNGRQDEPPDLDGPEVRAGSELAARPG